MEISATNRHPAADLRAAIPLFSGCSDTEWRALRAILSWRNLRAGEILFHQGEPCSAFYYLVEGNIKLCLRSRDSERVMEFVASGGTFGESALFAGEGYPLTAVALEDSEVLAFPAFPFVRLAQTHPNLALRIVGQVSRLYHQQLHKNARMALQSADQRVAAYLLDHCEDGLPEPRLPKRRRDLANLLNITPETLCRVIRRFKGRHWIRCNNEQIVITDTEGLRSML